MVVMISMKMTICFLQVRIKKYEFGKKNVWQQVPINVKMDVCQFSELSQHPFVKTFIPGLKESLGSLVHPCPYTVSTTGSFSMSIRVE
jgi:hypothetical protein